GYNEPSQPAPASPQVVVVESNSRKASNDDSAALISILIFVLGWFFWIPWIFGFMFIKNEDKTARLFGKLSIGCFFCCCVLGIIITIIVVVVVAAAAAATVDAYDSYNRNGYYTSY